MSTDSWGCAWAGDTWFTFVTLGWGSTSGNAMCTDNSLVRLEWRYQGGGWSDTGNQTSGIAWVQRGGSPADQLNGTHQIMVSGLWGQVEYTAE